MRVKLKDVFDLQMGKTPSRSNDTYWNGTHKWISIADLGKSGKYINNTKECITDRAISESKIKLVPRDTVIMSFKLSIGKAAITSEDMYTNEAIVAFKNKGIYSVDRNYLYYYCCGTDWGCGTNKAVMGLTLNKATLAEKVIELPGIDVQKDISKRLDKVDKMIRLLGNQLNLLEQLVKSRFVEMFGDPIANPFGWCVKRLEDISLLITNGNTPKGGSENYLSKGIVFLRSQNIWRNKIILDDVAYISAATHATMAKSSLHDKDILITKTGRINTENSSLGRAALFRGSNNSANINGHVYLVRLNETVVPEYVLKILTGEAYRRYIRKVCVGGIDKRQINLDQVENFPIIIPPIEMQKQFANFVVQVDKSKLAVKKSLEQLEILKKSLMQQYFG